MHSFQANAYFLKNKFAPTNRSNRETHHTTVLNLASHVDTNERRLTCNMDKKANEVLEVRTNVLVNLHTDCQWTWTIEQRNLLTAPADHYISKKTFPTTLHSLITLPGLSFHFLFCQRKKGGGSLQPNLASHSWDTNSGGLRSLTGPVGRSEGRRERL